MPLGGSNHSNAMHNNRTASILALLVAVLFASGCDTDGLTSQADTGLSTQADTGLSTSSEAARSASDYVTLDERLAHVAQEVPGFGGLFLDEQGHVNIYLRDPAKTTEAAASVIHSLVSSGSVPLRFSEAPTRVIQGHYDFVQLLEWKEAAHKLLEVNGVSLIDADEALNRVFVGVEDEDTRNRVIEVSESLEIPRNALLVEVTGGIRGQIRLTDRFRPFEGGFEIAVGEFSNGDDQHCTLGVHVVRSGTLGFVTNSHCTEVSGAVDGQPFFQNRWGWGPDLIATEAVDPAFTTTGAGRSGLNSMFGPPVSSTPYRHSDSAYASYVGRSININFGKIARTDYRRRYSSGSLERDGAFSITGNAGDGEIFVGLELNKVGRTTGWTYGPVTRTCFTAVDIDRPERELRCQYEVGALSDGGDSGSPVFSWSGGSNVRLFGLLWGGGFNPSGQRVFVFSSWNAINSELRASTSDPLVTHVAASEY